MCRALLSFYSKRILQTKMKKEEPASFKFLKKMFLKIVPYTTNYYLPYMKRNQRVILFFSLCQHLASLPQRCPKSDCLANEMVNRRVRGITPSVCTPTQASQRSGWFLAIVSHVIFDIICRYCV